MSMPAVLKHLAVLESGGLISRTKSGRTVTCVLRPEGIRAASSYLEGYRRFWSGALGRLADHLEQETR